MILSLTGGTESTASGGTIAVDHQTAVMLQHCGRIKQFGQGPRYSSSTNIPTDMHVELFAADAQIPERLRDALPCMLADNQNRERPVGIDDSGGRRIPRLQQARHEMNLD